MEASSNERADAVEILLEVKSDPNITDEVKFHYSHSLYNSNTIHYVTGW